MEKIREWGFPVALIAAWMFVAAYTVSLMIDAPGRSAPAPVRAEPVASAPQSPNS